MSKPPTKKKKVSTTQAKASYITLLDADTDDSEPELRGPLESSDEEDDVKTVLQLRLETPKIPTNHVTRSSPSCTVFSKSGPPRPWPKPDAMRKRSLAQAIRRLLTSSSQSNDILGPHLGSCIPPGPHGRWTFHETLAEPGLYWLLAHARSDQHV
jgi:hypothetical protein